MLREQMEKITGISCNEPADSIDFTSLLPRTEDNNGLLTARFEA